VDNLKTEHQEPKTLFKTLKKPRENSIIDEHHLKNNAEATLETRDLYKPDVDVKHRNILKKPARLLPLFLFKKNALENFYIVIFEIFNF